MAENIAILDNDDLNEYCLLQIFSYLSLNDILNVKQVCRKWRQVSQEWFKKIQTLSLDKNYFKYGRWQLLNNNSKRKICSGDNEKKLVSILHSCGHYMKNYYVIDRNRINDLNEEHIKLVFQLIPKLCKNIVDFRIQLSMKYSPRNLNTMTMHWFKLERLEFKCSSQSIENIFELLRNNQQLKIFSFELRTDNFLKDIIFTYLPTTIEEIKMGVMYPDFYDGFKNFISASENFTSLRKLAFSNLTHLNDNLVTAIAKIKSLRHLTMSDIMFYESNETINPIAKLTDLKSLDISNALYPPGDFVNIIECCTKLEKLRVITEMMTDKGIATIAKLEQLKMMIIYGENVDCCCMCQYIIDICDNLEVFVCRGSNLDNNDVIKLLKKATKLRFIDLDRSRYITSGIIDAAEKIANERKENIIYFTAYWTNFNVKRINTPYFKYFKNPRFIPFEVFPNNIKNCLEELYGW